MKLIQKYTDEYYASIQEIRNDFDVAGSHLIIDEIEKYRDQFRIYFMFHGQKKSIVLTARISELMNQHMMIQGDFLHPMIQIFMLRNEPELCLECLKRHHLSEKYLQTFDYIYSFEEDITKSFLEWLEHLSHHSLMKVINYEYKISFLTIKQRTFYDHYAQTYFDIETYQQKLQVSYETARLHLSRMCDLKILDCHKIGKKHVYKGVL